MWTLAGKAGVTSHHMITVYFRVTIALGQVFFGARKARQTWVCANKADGFAGRGNSHLNTSVLCSFTLSRHRESDLCFIVLVKT